MTDHLEFLELLKIFPKNISKVLDEFDYKKVIDIVLDVGRNLVIREVYVCTKIEDIIISYEDVNYIINNLPSFNSYDRSALCDCLHRISCMYNALGDIVGFTCRVGRPIPGAANIIKDLVTDGRSMLVLGKPGSGKSCILRDIANICSTSLGKRTIVVDSSNELAGDSDKPHYSIGDARRMQIPIGKKQSDIMLRAVTNHTPEVIIIDELNDRSDADAARTIAERGVQLFATAHGTSLHNLIDNPTLVELIGGIQTVTLSDSQALNKGCRKTVLERKHNPTFDVIVEIIDFNTVAVYKDVKYVVDCILDNYKVLPEIRTMVDGEIITEDAVIERILDDSDYIKEKITADFDEDKKSNGNGKLKPKVRRK